MIQLGMILFQILPLNFLRSSDVLVGVYLKKIPIEIIIPINKTHIIP